MSAAMFSPVGGLRKWPLKLDQEPAEAGYQKRRENDGMLAANHQLKLVANTGRLKPTVLR